MLYPYPYRGRFAPTPSGPLHFGSLVAALGSFLEARRRNGQWLLRIDDLDPPRELAGAADCILSALEAFGFEWDGAVMYQSKRGEAYQQAIERLDARGALFRCACTRKEVADSSLVFDGEHVYPGTCRQGVPPGRVARTTRVRVTDAIIEFVDAIQGNVRQDLAHEVGDFVVARADGLHAYQLAVVVDDAEQGISDIVRGADLLGCTGRQIFLQQLLGSPTPRYAHLPAAVNHQGEKLSKQTLARPLEASRAMPLLVAALSFLGQQPPPELARAAMRDIWRWARENWTLDKVPCRRSLPAPAIA
ncbi:MAG: tRNA glutamyl-Q(34) synthetase GluQRS [Betaproteobacteria bacterium RIFCSPLOWO2_12_FULL_63_13]|nr:MAG: tRNA glutamyl-Q(34) synthetase GluQRS [Betaproteobacteria bacterium RIFCSPLOWO2_02_FULL_63_19]OGA45518.1 MAG: tRNA glutamyl-Q(34) synthetase GluQRS [Betaproteobacteria bacterium RIFCSPLOWO2_12_FULL_63_13]